jgi:hypothetical protein
MSKIRKWDFPENKKFKKILEFYNSLITTWIDEI